MNTLIHLTLGLAASVSVSAFAAEANPALSAEAVAYHAQAAAKLQQIPRVRLSQPAAAGATVASPKVMGTSTYPGSPMANAFRAYPPSCAADPLPDASSSLFKRVTVPVYATSSAGGTTENVTITVWRLACSSSGNPTTYNPTGAFNAMTLVRIDRAANASSNVVPRFPQFLVKQGNIDFTTTKSMVRMAVEPNTVISDTPFDSPVISSTTYVLENYPYDGAGYFTFSDAFTLRINPFLNGVTPVDIAMDAYVPNQTDYPDAYASLPLDGYMSGNWYDPAHNGEGLVIEVAEQVSSTGKVTRPFVFDWYTFDSTGTPFWLAGDGIVDPAHPLSVTAGTIYRTGGGFAGSFGGEAPLSNWGTVTFQFLDCNTIKFTYQANANLPAGVPSGSGTKTWTRLTNVNGLTCE